MPVISEFISLRQYAVENFFSLAITQKQTSTKIIMQLLSNQINTATIPQIVKLLKLHLPTVLLTKCYNEENLPFALEVKNTETGHLFEHILLEYLCQLKIAKGCRSASYVGRTRWNWVRDPKGRFHISLSCGINDADILPQAVEKTIHLMKILYQVEHGTLFPTQFSLVPSGLKNGERAKRTKTLSL
jgi:hypothetical protein